MIVILNYLKDESIIFMHILFFILFFILLLSFILLLFFILLYQLIQFFIRFDRHILSFLLFYQLQQFFKLYYRHILFFILHFKLEFILHGVKGKNESYFNLMQFNFRIQGYSSKNSSVIDEFFDEFISICEVQLKQFFILILFYQHILFFR